MSIVRDSIIAELQERIARSAEYATIIESAKTKIKRDTYIKKLHKNNEIVADLLVSLDTIDKNREEKDVRLSDGEG